MSIDRELKKRTRYSLDQKIDFFLRFFEAGNKDININTKFEGKPIGLWAIAIRNEVKKGRTFTEEQFEILSRLGILEKGIDSTIEEKIDALIEWRKKYPDIIIDSKKECDPISENNIKKLEDVAKIEGVEFSEFEARYRKLRKYNIYVRARESIGKLTEKQFEKCREGNLGGKFGISTEMKELAGNLDYDTKHVSDIITNYGSVDNFVHMYRMGNLSYDEVLFYNKNLINNMIDMDNSPFVANYKKLICRILDSKFFEKNEVMLFSSRNVVVAINTLTSRESQMIGLKFGLIDGKSKTNGEIAKKYYLTENRINQTIKKAISKLSSPSRTYLFKPITIRELKANEFITDEERNALTELENDIWNSNLIFKNNSDDDLDFDKEKFAIIRTIQKSINVRVKEQKGDSQNRELAENIENITIKDLGLSTRAVKCLSRGGINTLADLKEVSLEKLNRIRSLGENTSLEIIDKLKEYGIVLKKDDETYEEERDCFFVTDECPEIIISYPASPKEEESTFSKIDTSTSDEAVSDTSDTILQEDTILKSESEVEEIKLKKAQLEEELVDLERRISEAKKLLNKYNEIIDADKVNTDNEEPDF